MHVAVRSGVDRTLEDLADHLLMEDREANGGEVDWLTEGQLVSCGYREVHNKNGFPEPNILEGRVFRAYNPLFGKRPRRHDAADW